MATTTVPPVPDPSRNEPIAIVGSSCRFPGGVSSSAKLWDLLRAPYDILEEPEPAREKANLQGFYHEDADHHGTTNVQRSYLLSGDPRWFDAAFFNIGASEAKSMDPQHRISLEVVYEALESGGHRMDVLRGSQTSVFAGQMTADYYDILAKDENTIPRYATLGMGRSMLSNRISHFFDWKGPSMTIDTACSSSLVAVHQAVKSLRTGESSLAVAAGANLILGPVFYIAATKMHMLSPDSRSRMWDAGANGYARGEGFAAVILKTLTQAIQDGDHIESVIRETGVNSDGHTTGISMPNAAAQTALICQTYQRAGLDPQIDRCEYFEAHGTGTPTGDPIEAKAVRDAFWPLKVDTGGPPVDEASAGEKLYIGSVKTVIGHTEGCAGLAGLLKASLALQHGIVPPNLHFENLNPSIQPFYTEMHIPTSAFPWPSNSRGQPRRASVNSFGYGGTNAHAIVESYVADPAPSDGLLFDAMPSLSSPPAACQAQAVGPFNVSADSESSLAANVTALADYLEDDRIHLLDVAYTLQLHRTYLPMRISFSSLSKETLLKSMRDFVRRSVESSHKLVTPALTMDGDMAPAVLGIFTGQGAQWPTMGRELMRTSPTFEKSIESLERSLGALPDAPTWSLKEELHADRTNSRIGEAALAQPLTTAVQLALIDALHISGIKFTAVVGHSSGEIAAAYAAGVLSAEDAIRVSYYRGLYATQLSSCSGLRGAMMAVGVAFPVAKEICDQAGFKGRVCVAASNSPSSTTLSGDEDAVLEIRDRLEPGTFARLLSVDVAYHSHHMQKIAEPYLESLRACQIAVRPVKSTCTWISSVTGDCIEDLESVKDIYWIENMTNPVHFFQAIKCSMYNGGPFNLAIEVGPHPALMKPVMETFQSTLGHDIPYVAPLKRGTNDVEALSSAIGFIWKSFSPSMIDFDAYREIFWLLPPGTRLYDLPTYSWDHRNLHWKESRLSKTFRTSAEPMHELLGRQCTGDSKYDMHWQNIIRLDEMPWLRGHLYQGQAIFPAAAYVSMALEAAKSIMAEKPVKAVELHDLVIHRAITIDEEDDGVELIFRLEVSDSVSMLEASFACLSGRQHADASLDKVCDGQIKLVCGDSALSVLPPRQLSSTTMTTVDVDHFYDGFLNMGLEYSGAFRSLRSIRRGAQIATSTASWGQGVELDRMHMVHPVFIDVGFQSVLATVGSPTSFRTTFLPTSIRRMVFNKQALCTCLAPYSPVELDYEAYYIGSSSLKGSMAEEKHMDLDLFHAPTGQPLVQIEGLTLTAVGEKDSSNDRWLFSKLIWKSDIYNDMAIGGDEAEDTGEDTDLVELATRVAYFYLRRLVESINREEIAGFQWYHQRFYEYAELQYLTVSAGQHQLVKKEWNLDTLEQLSPMIAEYFESVDLEAVRVAGEMLPAIVREEVSLLELLIRDGLLGRIYTSAFGFARSNSHVTQIVSRISHRYPHMRVLEIGAGTGAVTASALKGLGRFFTSYTFTDISSGFLEEASRKFAPHRTKMIFQKLNIEHHPSSQGFEVQSQDLVIAANVFHATSILRETLQHTRALLRPGGYLILYEMTGDVLRTACVMGGLPGWWAGGNDGRPLNPCLSAVQWDALLQETGFAGVDSISYDIRNSAFRLSSVMVSHAVDAKVNLIREPLSHLDKPIRDGHVLIIGGKTLHVSQMINKIGKLFLNADMRTTRVGDIDCLEQHQISSASAILCATELDKPLFKGFTPEKLQGIQRLFERARDVLWVTRGWRDGDPFASMTVGVARTIRAEMTHVNLQILDIPTKQADNLDPKFLVEVLLRLTLKEYFNASDVLWTTESELALDEKGRLLIPRIAPDEEKNNRVNSLHRKITVPAAKLNAVVDVSTVNDKVHVQAGTPLHSLRAPLRAPFVSVQVIYSSLCALRFADEANLFICLGTIVGSGRRVVALSRFNSSIVETLADWTIDCTSPIHLDPKYIVHVIGNLVANELLRSLGGGVLHLHEPETRLAKIVGIRAAQENIKLVCSASESTTRKIDSCIYIEPNTPSRALKKLLPQTVRKFVDLSFEESKTLACQIKAQLPGFCSKNEAREIFWSDASLDRSVSIQKVRDLLLLANTKALQMQFGYLKDPPVDLLSLADLSNDTPWKPSISILDWSHNTMALDLRPIDPTRIFSTDKTYFLIGLTGQLGQSLCQWMILHGAVYVVLASRKPNVTDTWLDEMANLGGRIKVMSMDVVDKRQLASVYQEVLDAMPPIAGVVNGAMVLADRPFTSMTYQDFETVLRPKADGAINLDELFYREQLDFFIMFSSLSAVTGNNGQANYAAANMSMSGIVTRRKQRGLAASILHIGLIVDLGYVAEGGRALEDNLLRKNTNMPLSESDFHQLFAEAIITGWHADESEIFAGIGTAKTSSLEEKQPIWFHNPLFSHLVLDQMESPDPIYSQEANVTTAKLLIDAATQDEVLAILQEKLVARLALSLQVAVESIDQTTPLVGMGVDSLIAVQIRSWFIKEIHVDVPVLKILSGNNIMQICKYVSDEREMSITKHMSEERDPSKAHAGTEDRIETSEIDLQEPQDEQSRALPTGIVYDASVHDASRMSSPSAIESSQEDSSFPSISIATPAPSNTDTDDLSTSPTSKEHLFERVELMSYAQTRLWFLNAYVKDPTSYNITLRYAVEGPLDVLKFIQAFYTVVTRHRLIQTCFSHDVQTGDPIQKILRSSGVKIVQKKAPDDSAVEQEMNQLRQHKYDLENGESFFCTLFIHSLNRCTLVFGYHHIIMDGFSWHIFLRDLGTAYEAQGSLAGPTMQYVDYSAKERALLENGSLAEDLAFWKSQFTSLPKPLPLFDFSCVKTRPSNYVYESNEVDLELPDTLNKAIRKASKSMNITPFQFYLTAVSVLLYRLLDINDFCIGVSEANRTDEQFVDVVGLFTNLLALQIHISGQQTFADAASQTSRTFLSGLAHSQIPFDVVLDELDVPRSVLHSPLFQVLVNYRMGSTKRVRLGDCEIDLQARTDAKTPYDIVLSISEDFEGRCWLTFATRRDLYDEDSSQLLMKLLVLLLGEFCQSPSLSLQDYPLFSKSEIDAGLHIGKGQLELNDWPDSFSRRFDINVQQYPHDVAIVDESTSPLTYAQLAKQVREIIHALTDAGSISGSYVAVLCKPGGLRIAALLAILRVEAIYVPLDLQNPRDRLIAMVQSCNPVAIICQDDTLAQVEGLSLLKVKVINLSRLMSSVGEDPIDEARDDIPAFAFFTSGSTGVPKGILLTQANVMASMKPLLADSKNLRARVLQQSSPGFDVSVYQTVRALAYGGVLVIVPSFMKGDADQISKLMLREDVSLTIATPTEYSTLYQHGAGILRQCSSWTLACVGGECIQAELKGQFHDLKLPHLQLIDIFGPTETGIVASGPVEYQKLCQPQSSQRQKIGYPLPNVSIYVLDKNLEPVATGYPGELCIAGASVGIGYVGDEALTKAKFLPDRFATREARVRGWKIMYRTGDKGRLFGDGSLIFLGRMDVNQQVKLRGHRIELDDIASSILHAANGVIAQATAVVREDPPVLIAFIVFSKLTAQQDSSSYLKKLLDKLPLPSYMCPTSIIPLDVLPVNINGKLDRRALEDIPIPRIEIVRPHTIIHGADGGLERIWRQTIPHIDRIVGGEILSKTTSFFHVGGTSILLLRLRELIRETFHVEVPLTQLFQHHSLGAMTSVISSMCREKHSPASNAFAMSSQDYSIDWDRETAFEKDDTTATTETFFEPKDPNSGIQALLTGSTSFLGQQILRNFVSDPRIISVYCVAVPSTDADSLYTMAAQQLEKLEIYSGDLKLPFLGLSNADAQRIFNKVDLIIHAGQEGSCINSYGSVRLPNLGATRELISLTLPRRIPFHFISSSRVAHLVGRTSLAEKSVANSMVTTNGSENGLALAKWACERYLETVAGMTGLIVRIHRHCALIGPDAPVTDALNALLKFSILLRSTPELGHFKGSVDYARVTVIAERMCGDILQDYQCNNIQRIHMQESEERVEKNVSFKHHTMSLNVPVQEFRSHLEQQEAQSFEELTVEEWIVRATQLGLSEFVGSYIENLCKEPEKTLLSPVLEVSQLALSAKIRKSI